MAMQEGERFHPETIGEWHAWLTDITSEATGCGWCCCGANRVTRFWAVE